MATPLTETLLNFLEKTISRLALEVFGNKPSPDSSEGFVTPSQGRSLADWESVYVNVSKSETSDIEGKDYLITLVPCNDRMCYYAFDKDFAKGRNDPNFTSFLSCISGYTFGDNGDKITYMARKGDKSVLAAGLDIYPDNTTILSTMPDNVTYHIDVGYAARFEVSFNEVLADLLREDVSLPEEVSNSSYIADLSGLNKPFTCDSEIEFLLSEMWKLTGQSAADIMKMIMSGRINLIASEEGAINPDYLTNLVTMVIYGSHGRIYYSLTEKKFYAVELLNSSGKIIPLDLLKDLKTWNHKLSMPVAPYESLLETVKTLNGKKFGNHFATGTASLTVKDNLTVEEQLVSLATRKNLSGAIQILDQINSRLRVECSEKIFFTYVDNTGTGPLKRNHYVRLKIQSITNYGPKKGIEVLVSLENQ